VEDLAISNKKNFAFVFIEEFEEGPDSPDYCEEGNCKSVP